MQGESLGYLRVRPEFSGDRPELMDVIRRMRTLADSYRGDRLLIGEVYLPIERLMAYYGRDNDGVHLPFNFKLLQADWTADEIDRTIRRYLDALPAGACPNWVLGNHDQPRIASKLGLPMARAAAVLLLTLPGAVTLYYGDELGMTDVEIPPDRWQDPRNWTEPGYGRDPERTPMQWGAGANAGFTTGKPWLPLADDYQRVNVEAQRADEASMLSLHRKLLALRKAEPALVSGRFQALPVHDGVLSYERIGETRRFLVAVNFADAPRDLVTDAAGILAAGTHPERAEGVGGFLTLKPHEAVVVRLYERP